MTHDILIAGGGLNGCTLAIALGQCGFRVALIDPTPHAIKANPEFDGRGYALSQSSVSMLKTLGLWSAVDENAQAMNEIKVSDGRPGEGPSPFVLEFDQHHIEGGPMGHLVEDRFLRRALLSTCDADPMIEVIHGRVINETCGPASISVTLEDGSEMGAALLIACDGKSSKIAQRAGIRRVGTSYDQTALVCAVGHERPHNGIAHQYFMPGGPLAILPLFGNRSSIVWAEKDAEARRIESLDDEGFMDELRLRFGDFLGDITLVGGRFSYPLELSIAEKFVAPRRALVGDAAHAVHPLAGQGLNAGLKDVAALAEVLVLAKRRGEDFGREDVLLRYQTWRRFDATALGVATDAFNRLFSNDVPALRLTRDIGLGLVNSWPQLRRMIVREAAGRTGDQPKLSRGLHI